MSLSAKPRTAEYYRDEDGREPVREFIKGLKDTIGRQKIRAKIRKAELGNFGSERIGYKHISGDVWELKIHYGPGYRVYFALVDDKIILLLLGGDKKSQEGDIKEACETWQRYKFRGQKK